MDVFLQPPYRYLLVVAITSIVLASCGFFAYRTNQTQYGWQQVQPGALHWLMIPLCLVLMAFLVAMVFNSGLPPFQGEYIIFYALMILFPGGLVFATLHIRAIRRANVHWRDHWLAFSDQNGRQVESMHDIVSISERWDKYIIVAFASGRRVKIDPYCRGSDRLGQTISDQIGERIKPNSRG